MDAIQKELIKAGRKDLAQEYYSRIAESAIKILFKNDFLELREIAIPNTPIKGYVYSHEKKSNGKKVVLLPFRKVDGKVQFLIRKEPVPCWEGMNFLPVSITGSLENNIPRETALHELKEEGGYEIEDIQLIDLGTSYGNKSCDTVYYLYTADLTEVPRDDAEGDGSDLEKQSYCEWKDSIDGAVDPFVYVCFRKMRSYIGE